MTMDTPSNPGKDQLNSVQDRQGTTATHGMPGTVGSTLDLDANGPRDRRPLLSPARHSGGGESDRHNATATYGLTYLRSADNWNKKWHRSMSTASAGGQAAGS